MTTTDHPDLILTDRRSAIMDAARATVAEIHQQTRREHELRANAAVAEALPTISAFLESYGADPTNGIASGPCTDPDHALAWVTTAAGFSFDIVDEPHRYLNERRPVAWLLHPETGARVCRLPSSWEHAASLLVAESVDTIDPTPEPERDHPAETLVDALRAFVRSLDERMDGGF